MNHDYIRPRALFATHRDNVPSNDSMALIFLLNIFILLHDTSSKSILLHLSGFPVAMALRFRHLAQTFFLSKAANLDHGITLPHGDIAFQGFSYWLCTYDIRSILLTTTI
jgi:hypothetical protein